MLIFVTVDSTLGFGQSVLNLHKVTPLVGWRAN